jgi:hypothetical protein
MIPKTEQKMKSLIILGTTLLSFALTAPAGAAALSHPDACRAIYPNANCLNTGPGNPYSGYAGLYARSNTPDLVPYGAYATAPFVPYAWDDGYAVGIGY